MHLVLIGITGSGKTTIAREIAANLDLTIISSGDIARSLAAQDASTAMALRQGAMAPEQAMRHAVRTQLEVADATQGNWILDGFPRTIEQLICITQWSAIMPTFVYLEIEPWLAIERLTARSRPDDNPDSIARKIHSFEEKTQPMLEILEGGGILHTLRVEEYELSGIVNAIENLSQ